MKNGRSVRSGHFIFDLLPAIRFKVISSPSAVALTNLRGNPRIIIGMNLLRSLRVDSLTVLFQKCEPFRLRNAFKNSPSLIAALWTPLFLVWEKAIIAVMPLAGHCQQITGKVQRFGKHVTLLFHFLKSGRFLNKRKKTQNTFWICISYICEVLAGNWQLHRKNPPHTIPAKSTPYLIHIFADCPRAILCFLGKLL